jgi:hypothetical protein
VRNVCWLSGFPSSCPQELDVPTVPTLSKWKWIVCRSIPPWNDPATEL